MFEVPSETQEWLVLGAPLVCREPFDIDIELLGVKGKFHVKKGDKAEVVEFMDEYIRVGFFDFFGTRRKEGYIQHLRLDLIYFWEPEFEVTQRGLAERAKVPMILDRHPDQPGKKTKERYIGYWASHEDPAVCHYAQKENVLPWPGDFVDTSWDPQERATVVAYLNGAPDVEFWMGYPHCRFKCPHSTDLGTTDKGDGTYVWPAGFGHYLEAHGVKPPVEFIQYVLNKVAK